MCMKLRELIAEIVTVVRRRLQNASDEESKQATVRLRRFLQSHIASIFGLKRKGVFPFSVTIMRMVIQLIHNNGV